ncbi:hypothetical protein RF11_07921 [Thelohanellus kitauei]|uniref:Uncharacterized protein n=1 Tax=Thelohanellus kitauei TaxID=669202 RepID=A0A0C2M8C0_THEKT|nr:hypothetical protein RF11_07921 [Thelohanellus kitauei]
MTDETNSSKARRSGSNPKRLPSTVTLGHTSYQLKDSLKSVQALRQKPKPTQANLAGHNVSLSQRFNGYRSTESSWNVRGLMATVFMFFTLSHGCLAQLMPQGPSMLITHRFHQINPFPQLSIMANNLLTQPSIPPFPQLSGTLQNAVTPNPFGSYAINIKQLTTPVVTPVQVHLN